MHRKRLRSYPGNHRVHALHNHKFISHDLREIKQMMHTGFERIERSRRENIIIIQSKEKTIEEMAGGHEKFIAGLLEKLTERETSLFFALVHKQPDDFGKIRALSYAEIGRRLGRITKQAVSARCKKIKSKHMQVWDYIQSVRKSQETIPFSALSPSMRRKEGIDETYNYDAD